MLISTHTKYAPSQAQWLRPLDDLAPAELVGDLLPRPAELSRIDGQAAADPAQPRRAAAALPPRPDRDQRAAKRGPTCFDTASRADAGRIEYRPAFYGFLFPGRDSGLFGTFYELLVSAGGKLFDDDLRPAFASAAGHWAVEQIADLHQRRRVTPRDLTHWHYDDISASFRAGDAAMVSDWPGSYHLYRDPATCRVADRVGLALLPAGPGGHSCRLRRLPLVCRLPARRANPDGGDGARPPSHVVRRRSLARPGTAPSRAARARSPPCAAEAAADPAAAERWRLLAETEQTMIIPPRFAAYPQCEDALWRSVQRAMIGRRLAADAVRHAAAEIAGHRGDARARSAPRSRCDVRRQDRAGHRRGQRHRAGRRAAHGRVRARASR